MGPRQKQILTYITEHNSATKDELIKTFRWWGMGEIDRIMTNVLNLLRKGNHIEQIEAGKWVLAGKRKKRKSNQNKLF